MTFKDRFFAFANTTHGAIILAVIGLIIILIVDNIAIYGINGAFSFFQR